jgi:uncharacterized membrane protein
MINDIGNFIFNFCIFVLIFAFQIIKPKLARKEIYFGIRMTQRFLLKRGLVLDGQLI